MIDTDTQHTQAVLRDADDRTPNHRWQQQLPSFMSEVTELMRSEGARDSAAAVIDAAAPEPAPLTDSGFDETTEA